MPSSDQLRSIGTTKSAGPANTARFRYRSLPTPRADLLPDDVPTLPGTAADERRGPRLARKIVADVEMGVRCNGFQCGEGWLRPAQERRARDGLHEYGVLSSPGPGVS
jgi:hypothetical protein